MNLLEAIEKAGRILDEERVQPTVGYQQRTLPAKIADAVTQYPSLRGKRCRQVQEDPALFEFNSTNFDLLSALLDQVQQEDKRAIFAFLRSRIADARSYRHRSQEVLGSGAWARSSSELPLIAEFLVRRGDKEHFIGALGEAGASPGLTLLLMQLEDMIAFNFTLFNDEEYELLPDTMASIMRTIADLEKRPKPSSTLESNTIYHVRHEVPAFCRCVLEVCRKARYLYVKSSLLPGINVEVNQDKNRVRKFLEKLGFTPLLIESLDEAERLYRTTATRFELKSSMGHLRSFLEELHLQACSAAHKKFGGDRPAKWGEALKYLRDHDVLTKHEELFAAQFYTLMSDTAVHPLAAEREYARLMRNMSIEYGLLLLTKLDKLGLN